MPILHTDKGVALYSYNELQDMTDATYKLWDQLHAERRQGGFAGCSSIERSWPNPDT